AGETRKDNKLKNDLGAARQVNQQHFALGISASSAAHTATPRLSDVKQAFDYADLVRMSDKKARSILVQHGCLQGKLAGIRCWQCGSKMSGGGGALPFRLFLCFCFLVGARIPLDSMVVILHEKNTDFGRKQAERWYAVLRLALAYAEMKEQNEQILQGEIVEVQNGRVLVITGRSSKQTVFKPLPSKTQKRGAPGGTESLAEILPHLEKHVDKKTAVACSDAGAGLRAAWSSMAVPAATARHNLDEFTPVKTLRVKDLTPGQRRTLAKNAAAKKPAAAFTLAADVTLRDASTDAESQHVRARTEVRRVLVGHLLTFAYYRLVVRQLRELKGTPPKDIYVTRHGQCYRRDAFCPSPRNSQPTGKPKCHLCYPYTSTGP
ncbi:unnamed protein product, partial [Symbiodinium natans]